MGGRGEPNLTESQYWLCLEFRLCGEFKGMEDKALRRCWCDGLLPQHYFLDDSDARIEGTAFIWNGPKCEEWNFTLLLGQPIVSRSDINWNSLLPADDVTRWMAVDMHSRRMQIEPSAAVPDLA